MMAWGCFVALYLWLALASVWLGSLVPLALGVVFIVAVTAYRGIQSDWPLY